MTRLATLSADVHPLTPAGHAAGVARVVDRRRRRFQLLETVRANTPRKGGQVCMFALDKSVHISADRSGKVGIRGSRRCASPWACPVCAPTIAETRAGEIDQMISAWRARGGSCIFVTATVRHHAGQTLNHLLTNVQSAWSDTFRFSRRPDWYRGQLRTVEITHGANGWHPHVHAVVFVHAGHDVERVGNQLRTRWANSCTKLGLSTKVTGASPGFDVRRVRDAAGVGRYLNKVADGWGAGLEMVRHDLKRGKVPTSRNPWQLLEQADAGDSAALELWREYERATKGSQCVVVTPGLKAELSIDEVSDVEAAEGEGPETPTVTVLVPAKDWKRLLLAGAAGKLLADIANMATGVDRDGWAWPPWWLLTHHEVHHLGVA